MSIVFTGPCTITSLPVYTFDSLSSTAISSMQGIYSLSRLLSSYSGPIINIRRSTDNVTSDFYRDSAGDLTTLAGQSYTSWIGAATGLVTTWYDQSGKGNHASQTTQTNQPSLNSSSRLLNFDSSDFLTMRAGTVPMNNTYTVSLRHGTSTNSNGGFIGAGQVFVSNRVNNFRRGAGGYNNYWWGNDFSGGTFTANNTVTWVFGPEGTTGPLTSGTTVLYVNGTSVGSRNRSGWAGVSDTTDYIGTTSFLTNSEFLTGQLYWVAIFNSALTTADRRIVESIN